MEPFPETERTRLRRTDRATHDRALAYEILDAALHCHVAVVDHGRPLVVPVLHVRVGDDLVIHGSPASRFFRVLRRGVDVTAVATLLDGLVLARSAFHHSANYRSAIVFGTSVPVSDLDERRMLLDTFTDRLVPGRRPSLRRMTEREVKATSVIRVPIAEGSAKVRTGPPVDDDEDEGLPIWAGVVPVDTVFGSPVPDPRNLAGVDVPEHVRDMVDR